MNAFWLSAVVYGHVFLIFHILPYRRASFFFPTFVIFLRPYKIMFHVAINVRFSTYPLLPYICHFPRTPAVRSGTSLRPCMPLNKKEMHIWNKGGAHTLLIRSVARSYPCAHFVLCLQLYAAHFWTARRGNTIY